MSLIQLTFEAFQCNEITYIMSKECQSLRVVGKKVFA